MRQSTGRVEYMCNVDGAVPPLLPPAAGHRDVLQQVVDATVPDVQLLPPSPPPPQQQQPALPAPRVNLTSSIGKYSVHYPAGHATNAVRIVKN